MNVKSVEKSRATDRIKSIALPRYYCTGALAAPRQTPCHTPATRPSALLLYRRARRAAPDSMPTHLQRTLPRYYCTARQTRCAKTLMELLATCRAAGSGGGRRCCYHLEAVSRVRAAVGVHRGPPPGGRAVGVLWGLESQGYASGLRSPYLACKTARWGDCMHSPRRRGRFWLE